MTLAETLTTVQYIVDSQGRRTDVVLPLETWKAVLSWLEDREDIIAVQERWAARETRANWPTLGEVEAELAADGLL